MSTKMGLATGLQIYPKEALCSQESHHTLRDRHHLPEKVDHENKRQR